MDGGKDWLEVVLKRKAYEDAPMKVLEVDTSGSGPGKGENYLSQIQKIKAKVLLGSGRVKNISFLVKSQHETEHMKKMTDEGGMFLKEITMYRDILPKMECLLEEINDPEGVFWAKCYDFRLYNRIVFEDLGDSGYRMADRMQQLSLNAALIALRHFAKFHALSRVLIDRGDIPLELFGKSTWFTKPEGVEMTKRMVAGNMEKMCKVMESWGDEWKEAIERLKAADIAQSFIDSFFAKPDEFATLCHGDSWTNNMMFRGEDLENPTSFRLIDLQICFVCSPAKDIYQFLLTSVRLEDRKQHTDLMLQTYTDTLRTYLLKCGYEGPIPDVQSIKNSLESRAALMLCDAIGFVPIVLAQAQHAPDLEDAMKKYKEAEERGEKSFDFFTLHQHLTPKAEAIIKEEIRRAMDSGLI